MRNFFTLILVFFMIFIMSGCEQKQSVEEAGLQLIDYEYDSKQEILEGLVHNVSKNTYQIVNIEFDFIDNNDKVIDTVSNHLLYLKPDDIWKFEIKPDLFLAKFDEPNISENLDIRLKSLSGKFHVMDDTMLQTAEGKDRIELVSDEFTGQNIGGVVLNNTDDSVNMIARYHFYDENSHVIECVEKLFTELPAGEEYNFKIPVSFKIGKEYDVYTSQIIASKP